MMEGVDIAAMGYMAANITSAVSVVFLNKWLFNVLGFPHPITVVFFHFVGTTIGLVLSLLFGLFTFKKIDILPVIPLSAAFCGFVVLTNLSLSYNSVGFYQLTKVLTTPCVMVLETVFFAKRSSLNTIVSLLVVCAGVVVATVSDVTATILGSIIALSGILCTAIYQIWVGTYQKKYEINSPQLLLYQAPTSAILLMIVGPFLDNTQEIYNFEISTEFLIVLVLSCLAAFFVNLSTFLLIGRTSPLTYNAVGYAKLALVLSGGFVLFGQPISATVFAGIVLMFLGLFAYTREKLKLQAQAHAETILPTKLEETELQVISPEELPNQEK